MIDDRERLLHIIEALERIEAVYAVDPALSDEKNQVWILHHLLIIGEASGRLSAEFRTNNPHVPWPKVMALRNIIVHEYFGVDINQIRDTVTTDLPRLMEQVKGLLRSLGDAS